ncbi:MAG TPA: type II toxin-antitoxin system antitoxin SocA domain-containing protein [Williamwhitmania sp.]|nr:type II toxin-antitoxin system antitoxin SocA domain-containing protein [Williamwhitmania sp.]
MAKEEKVYLFEYMIKSVVDKYKTLNHVEENVAFSVFSKLKLIKLNFFISAVNTDEKDNGLLDVFDNFYAMPYGHVESDVYNSIKEGELKFFNLTETSLNRKCIFETNSRFSKEESRIDDAIDSLLEKNSKFFDYTAFQLVELSHEWYSWRLVFDIAQKNGKFSSPIPPEIIQSEEKIFELSNYASV